MSITTLEAREIVQVQLTSDLELGDLRPFANQWPILQAMRYSETQSLAADALKHGFKGLIFHSAQQYSEPCIVIFNPDQKLFRKLGESSFVSASGAIHRYVAHAANRSRIPLAP